MSATLDDAIQQLDNTKQAMDNLVATVEAKQGGIDTEVQEAITEMNTEVDQAKSSLTIIATDGYRKAVEAATGGRNTVLYDDHGNPNIMVVIPRFTYDDLGMTDTMGTGTVTAFLKDGQELPEIFIGKYLASGNQAQSLPNMDPKTSINFDEAKAACQAKGDGWHLMTAHEWAAIALWCVANGFQPRGNTQFGRAHNAFHEFGLRGDGLAPNDRNGTSRTKTGSGPATWTHDRTDAGIYDLVGNIWEWQNLLKLENGQVVCSPDNNSEAEESSWLAQVAFFDSPNSGDDAGEDNLGAPVLAPRVNNSAGPVGDDGYFDYNSRGDWINTEKSDDYSSNFLLKRMLVEPVGDEMPGRVWVRNYGTRYLFRGGSGADNSVSGLGAINLGRSRSHRGITIGFRPCYIAPTS